MANLVREACQSVLALTLAGSGKTLLLLGLLGEADLLAGQIICPRSTPNAMDDIGQKVSQEDWILANMCGMCRLERHGPANIYQRTFLNKPGCRMQRSKTTSFSVRHGMKSGTSVSWMLVVSGQISVFSRTVIKRACRAARMFRADLG